MKKKLVVISLIFIVIIFTVCKFNNEKIPMEKSKYNNIKPSDKISAVITEKDITTRTIDLNLVFTNNGVGEYTFDREPYLEKEIDNEWYKVPVLMKVHWSDIAILLPVQENFKESINLHDYYGKLQKGKYRYIKKFNFDTEEEFVIIEFNIK